MILHGIYLSTALLLIFHRQHPSDWRWPTWLKQRAQPRTDFASSHLVRFPKTPAALRYLLPCQLRGGRSTHVELALEDQVLEAFIVFFCACRLTAAQCNFESTNGAISNLSTSYRSHKNPESRLGSMAFASCPRAHSNQSIRMVPGH